MSNRQHQRAKGKAAGATKKALQQNPVLLQQVRQEMKKDTRTPRVEAVQLAVRKLPINPFFVSAFINSLLQEALSLGFISSTADANANDYANAFIELHGDFYRAVQGKITQIREVPEIFKIACDAARPTITQDGFEQYSYDENDIPTSFPETLLKWGEMSGEYDGSSGMIAIQSPFTPSGDETVRLASTARIITFMKGQGVRVVDRDSVSGFESDTSVFAVFRGDPAINDVSIPGRADKQYGSVHHERPINHIWLAALRLTEDTPTRVDNFQRPIFGFPHNYFSARMKSPYHGKKGGGMQVRVSQVKLQEFIIVYGSMLQRCHEVQRESSATDSPQADYFGAGDITAFENWVLHVCMSSFFKDSSAIFGLEGKEGRSPAWGAQFRPTGVTNQSQMLAPAVIMETLRRLESYFDSTSTSPTRPDGTREPDTFFIQVPVVSRPSFEYGPPTWVDALFPNTFDPVTCSDSGVYVINCPTVAGYYQFFLDSLQTSHSKAIEHIELSAILQQSESAAGQRLGVFRRVILELDEEFLKRKLTGATQNQKLTGMDKIRQKVANGSVVRLKYSDYLREKERRQNSFTMSTFLEAGHVAWAASRGAGQPFLALILPVTYAHPSGSSSTLEAMSLAVNRSPVKYYDTNQSFSDYLDGLIKTYNTFVITRGSDRNPTELSKLLKKRGDQGLGGSLIPSGQVINAAVDIALKAAHGITSVVDKAKTNKQRRQDNKKKK